METPSATDIPDKEKDSSLHCCCGRSDCAYLQHNNVALEGLEKDVQTAAQLGQALLARHEAYMVDAERQRKQMNDSFLSLEQEKRDTEDENTRLTEENERVLRQLEELNSELAESDAHVKSLTAALQSSQQEIQRLTVLNTRTTQLELDLMELEQERSRLQNQALTSDEAEKVAMQRWLRSERMLADLQDQIQNIEKEAHEERKRHIEVEGRLERRRAVEKELESAAGRLKGAAAASSLGRGQNSSKVVSHFVKDILQDNANLQLGIVELRDMLATSNDEVQLLREQLLLNRSAPSSEREPDKPADLRAELGPGFEYNKAASQELHVHHHYHPHVIPKPSENQQSRERLGIRRTKKRRQVVQPTSSHRRSGSMVATPTQPGSPSTASTILSQTSVTVPTSGPPYQPSEASSPTSRWAQNHRSSVTLSLSTAASSVPNSPQSSRYLFDTLGDALDSSRPTTPESSITSPYLGPSDSLHSRKGSNTSFRSFTAPFANTSVPYTTLTSAVIEEEVPPEVGAVNSPPFSPIQSKHQLRRRASAISISSIQGMDIHSSNAPHLLRTRPSQLTIRSSIPSTALTTLAPVSTSAIATPNVNGKDATVQSRSLLLSIVSERGADSQRSKHTDASNPPHSKPLSKKSSSLGLGGWIAGRWGVTTSSTAGTTATDKSPISSPSRPIAVSSESDGPNNLSISLR